MNNLMMITTVSFGVALSGMSGASASTLPSYIIGTWTSVKSRCKSQEYVTTITNKSFDQYESSCRINKISEHNNVTPGFYYYAIDLKCNDEGEMTERSITFLHKANKTVMNIGGLGKSQIVYRCGGNNK